MSQQGMITTVLATGLSNALKSDGSDHTPGFGPNVQAWIKQTAEALAPNQLRQTRLGMLPVDVNTIDQLDKALTDAADLLEGNRLKLEKAEQQVREMVTAVRYAEARINLDDPDWFPFLSQEAKDEAKRQLKRARKAYLRQIGRGE